MHVSINVKNTHFNCNHKIYLPSQYLGLKETLSRAAVCSTRTTEIAKDSNLRK